MMSSVRNGFILPVVAVLLAVLVVLALALSSLTDHQRGNARAWVDHQRAELAVRSGIEEAAGILTKETAGDSYLVLQHTAPRSPDVVGVPYGFIASPDGQSSAHAFRYRPLFSCSRLPVETPRLMVPLPDDCRSPTPADIVSFKADPWLEDVAVDWISVPDRDGVGAVRYAYWIEDLQARIDPVVAGNLEGANGRHARVGYPFPDGSAASPSGMIGTHSLSQLPLYPLSPTATDSDQGLLATRLIGNRSWMRSPESALAAARFEPPLRRLDRPDPLTGGLIGELVDPEARAVEENLIVEIRPYRELPVVPPVAGIDDAVVGLPRLNLNAMVARGGEASVNEMANWIESAMPQFASRKGGFPDDYLKTLAASAIDYADRDDQSTRDGNSFAGVDSSPVLSELVLHIHFKKATKVGSRWVLAWTFRWFAELWNMSSQPIRNGRARLSYEVDLRPTPLGAASGSVPFDDSSILRDPSQSSHQLSWMQGGWFGPEVSVTLQPDEYRFYEFATVEYTLDYQPQFDRNGIPVAEMFDLEEPASAARGATLLWNDQPVGRVPAIVRDPYGVSQFKTDQTRKTAKACIPGLNYGSYGEMINNMGDPRIVPYIRSVRVGENAYPENLSPHRRNVRRYNIYDPDKSAEKSKHYGRVMPSEWPDGGHDSPLGDFRVTTSDAALPTQEDKWPLAAVPQPQRENAPQRISNAGRYYSVTELGRVFDPVMWQPAYPDLQGIAGSGVQDTNLLLGIKSPGGVPTMPSRRHHWPEVSLASVASNAYGGGNTLRIGRPEHERFNHDGLRASQLLDLFHVGIARSDDPLLREGACVEIDGNININTAGRDVLRCMAAGFLVQDPGLCRVTDWSHETSYRFAPSVQSLQLSAPQVVMLADRIADAIIRNRPYVSVSQLAQVKDENGRPVFGDPSIYPDGDRIQWTDAAAEEVFARMHDAATVRSRNFRVWVIGQRIEGSMPNVRVLAESRKVFTVFCNPGERTEQGQIDPSKFKVQILNERAF